MLGKKLRNRTKSKERVVKSPRSLLGGEEKLPEQLYKVFVVSFAQNNAKVAVLGASGGIGQPLSLLLKNSPLVSKLSLYDIAHTPGVAADLSHIETKAAVKGTLGMLWVPEGSSHRAGSDPKCPMLVRGDLHPLILKPSINLSSFFPRAASD